MRGLRQLHPDTNFITRMDLGRVHDSLVSGAAASGRGHRDAGCVQLTMQEEAGCRMNAWLVLLTFCCGAAYECGCVFWVHYSESNRSGYAVAWSMFNALVTVLGIETFLKSWVYAAAYVLGYGFGTYVAIQIKQRWFR